MFIWAKGGRGMNVILEQAGIPLRLFVICMFYGIRMMILQDASTILGKNVQGLKDETQYARNAGVLIILLGIASLLMGIFMMINTYIAVVEIVVCILIIGILWKKMNQKYGM